MNNKIKLFKGKKMKNPKEDTMPLDDVQKESEVPLIDTLDVYISNLIGIHSCFRSCSYKFKNPFKTMMPSDPWGYYDYHIVFVKRGILISMSEDMIKKIPILKSILLDNNGYDKGMRLNYICPCSGEDIEGPMLYITKLPLGSLIFDKPSSDYDVRRPDPIQAREDVEPLSLYFIYDNVEEAIVNFQWY